MTRTHPPPRAVSMSPPDSRLDAPSAHGTTNPRAHLACDVIPLGAGPGRKRGTRLGATLKASSAEALRA